MTRWALRRSRPPAVAPITWYSRQTCHFIYLHVCEKLEIGAESDYFGLRVSPPSGPARWLNLRNPLDPHRIPGKRLQLRVKFWVPPHLLINEPTRHQFYLHAKLVLTDGTLVVADLEVARRIVAYIAQAETGDCDPDAPPLHVYEECSKIGPQGDRPDDHVQKIIEYHCEMAGMRASQAEYRLLKAISNLESFGEELFFCKTVNEFNNAHNLYSHLLYHGRAQEERRRGDEQEIDGGGTVGCLAGGGGGGCGCRLSTCVGVGPRGLVVYRPACTADHDIGEEKQRLRLGVTYEKGVTLGNVTMSHRTREARRLASLPLNYDRSAARSTRELVHSLQMYCKLFIPYTAILRAQPLRNMFQLWYASSESGHEAALHVKLGTRGQAAALYRAVTEKHAFYCCETVRTDVTEQFIRDLKGTIASIFKDSTTLGRRYVFDIRRTCREVHDRARRAAHARALAALEPRARRRSAQHSDTEECVETRVSSSGSGSGSGSEAFACGVCMDAPMDTVFLPCRHVLCCGTCAPKCERCPLCRREIEQSMHIFLPIEYQKIG
ncbi:E3 ubiquitin-protein ligase MYLIP [Eumeta japonica]|uniref:E3 ubiquitin-protein ligase MYLIP n=1 Tax=Eumeta variegata TaxID=151549 RepID=A0A4C1Z6J9_EUMVA|nr:E3 ubiquitin-protein ligase MYLIP [Eumeta japonica]